MPAPMTTTRAVGGTEAIKASFRSSEVSLLIAQHCAPFATPSHPASAVGCVSTRPAHAPLLRQRCQRVTSGSLFDTVVGVLSTGKERSGQEMPFSQALALSGLASTHFLAAASGSILSWAMYFATRF